MAGSGSGQSGQGGGLMPYASRTSEQARASKRRWNETQRERALRISGLRERYRAGVIAVRRGADPHLTLSWVLWPSVEVEEAQREKAAA
jgi:hypothetical protein